MDLFLARGASAAVLCALLVLPAAAQRMERYTPPPTGSSWVTENKDSGSYGAGVSEVPMQVVPYSWQGRALLGFRSTHFTTVLDPAGSWIAQVSPEGNPLMSWEPPLSWDWPLEVGKRWTRQYQLKLHAQDLTLPLEAKYEVEAHEEVAVAAGTFTAFRVRASNSLGEDSVMWLNPDHGLWVKGEFNRSEKHPAGAGRREFQLKSLKVQR